MKVGILIIGSLFWDGGARETWRNAHLNLDTKAIVTAPIRYGRKSRSRGNTYTMVFDPSAVGKALLIQTRAHINTIEELRSEAQALWKAEYSDATENSLGTSWGCVGLLPKGQDYSNTVEKWRTAFRGNVKAIHPVTDDGILKIEWPKLPNGNAAPYDLILATATKVEAKQPSPNEIADAWIRQSGGHEQYFINNIRSCIRTSDDLQIWSRVSERLPPWLENADYADVVNMLGLP